MLYGLGLLLTEYRLEELSRVTGVSARNIRAYRERGLLDPPRRRGRTAIYDDFHVQQLEIINQLLRKGFKSTHIAEFFVGVREGHSLTDILGFQHAMLGGWVEKLSGQVAREPRAVSAPSPPLIVDADSAEAKRLVELGMARLGDVGLELVDPVIAEIVARAPDQAMYLRAVVQVYESTKDTIDALATQIVGALQECVIERFGTNFIPKPEEMEELSSVVSDHRDLGSRVVADRLDEALQQQVVRALSDYTAELLLSGRWTDRT